MVSVDIAALSGCVTLHIVIERPVRVKLMMVSYREPRTPPLPLPKPLTEPLTFGQQQQQPFSQGSGE